MEPITIEIILPLSPDAAKYRSFATETITLRRHDEASGSWLSMTCSNLEPDADYDENTVTLTPEQAEEICNEIVKFARNIKDSAVK